MRTLVLLEDDWEIGGDGLGDVARMQYLPAAALMNTAAELGITCTFMVDVMQQLVFRAHAARHPELRPQVQLWDEAVRLMKERGFDVQLHVHPQWQTARLVDGLFRVDGNWNLATWPDAERRSMLERSIAYLHELLREIDPSYRVRAYKAGAWGAQPSGGLLADLKALGVKLVLAPRRGMHLPDVKVDYRGLEEDTLPYHPVPDDIRRVSSTERDLIVVPLAWYEPSLGQVGQLFAGKLRRRLLADADPAAALVPPGWTAGQPIAGPRATVREGLRYSTHLKLGDQPFSYLRRSFDDVLARVADLDADLVVLVIESHTKDHVGNFRDVRRFLHDVVARHGDRVEFVDTTRLLAILEADPSLVRGAHAGFSATP